jgi:putative ABC transport system permease protein
VSRRTHEIGIRIALGASNGHVLRMILSSGLRLLAYGTASGLLFGFALQDLLRSQIWGTPDYDPMTLAPVVLLMAIVGVAACYAPARRATRVDPGIALRHE